MDKLGYAMRQIERTMESIENGWILPVSRNAEIPACLAKIADHFTVSDASLSRFVSLRDRYAFRAAITDQLVPAQLEALFREMTSARDEKEKCVKSGDYATAAIHLNEERRFKVAIAQTAPNTTVEITPNILISALQTIGCFESTPKERIDEN